MYSYKYDTETGGLLLIDTLSQFSKEPRPVYSRELDLLGFDKIWKYEKTDEAPYLWAEAQFYFYRGKRVAKTIGGSLYERPNIELETDETGNEILPEGSILQPVDVAAMVEKNHNLIEILECEAVKKIYDVYKRYSKKLDCFHVAFSGGKDSIVLLELVKRALPANSFIVVFGDTGMEFPDTYETVNVVEAQCKADGVAFYRASSHLKPEESWRLFGPPSRVLRWCCSVHKSVPQTLKLREILGKNDYSGMAFVGVRAAESAARADYEFEMDDQKIKGQKTRNPIIEWSSAEVWLYIFLRKLQINKAYIKGNQRAGCLLCPMSLKTDYIKKTCYPKEFGFLESILQRHYSKANIENGYWCSRINGTSLKDNTQKIHESIVGTNIVITVSKPSSSISEWLRTLGEVSLPYHVTENENGFTIRFPQKLSQKEVLERSYLTAIIHKATYCIGCGFCESNCPNECLSVVNGLRVKDCKHCQMCNKIDGGCLVYKSLRFPNTYGEKTMRYLDCFNTHAPKTDWLSDFFARENVFLTENSLGPEQKKNFRTFLKECSLINKDGFSSFARLLKNIGWDDFIALELLLCNLAYNSQFNWYIKNMQIGTIYDRESIIQMLKKQGNKDNASKHITSAYKRFCELPIGTKLHFGEVTKKNEFLKTLKRTKTVIPDDDVVLYSLYKFAEACDGYYEFTLSRLMDFTVDSAGVSPAEIFGLSREEMEQFLNSLSRSRPEFVSYTATHDLEVIRLADDKKASDVLSLFQGARK